MSKSLRILFLFFSITFSFAKGSNVTAQQVFANIEWATKNGMVLEKIENVSFVDKAGTQKTGILEIIKQEDGKLGVRVIDDMGNIINILDEDAFIALSKDVKYLPGPQLPEKIAETFTNFEYTNRKLINDEIFYKYHGTNNRTGRKYAWYSKKKYTTELELRQKLAIKDDWGIQIDFVTEFNVPTGTWVSEGKAAAQGVGYPGQDYQAVILNTPNSWIIRTDKAFK